MLDSVFLGEPTLDLSAKIEAVLLVLRLRGRCGAVSGSLYRLWDLYIRASVLSLLEKPCCVASSSEILNKAPTPPLESSAENLVD